VPDYRPRAILPQACGVFGAAWARSKMPERLFHLLAWTVAIVVLAMMGVMLAVLRGWIQT
jgi:hypothetical protein